jgi:hypothetical protein
MEPVQVSWVAKARALQPPGLPPARRAAQAPRPEELRCQPPMIVAARRSLAAESAAPNRESVQTDRRNSGAVSPLAAGSRHRRPPEVQATQVDPVRRQMSAPALERLREKALTAAPTNAG